MYIPSSFLGQSGLSAVSSSGAQTVGYVMSGSQLWKYEQFATGNRTYNIHSGSAYYKLMVVGAGGSGGMRANTTAAGSAGGGGGGGFMYLENLILTSGSYNIFVGSGSNAATSSLTNGLSFNGQDSYFDYIFRPTSPDPGYFITSSRIVAYGGGGGSILNGSSPGDASGVAGKNGASGGGGLVFTNGFVNIATQPGVALYNSTNLPPHGFRGGPVTASDNRWGSGGGGAGSEGGGQNFSFPSAGSGGAGFDVGFTGYAGVFCGGGQGLRDTTVGSPGSAIGGGGGGVIRANPISANGRGRDGTVILLHKEATSVLSECREFVVKGGNLGGTITYFECGTSTLASASIDFNQEVALCTKPISFRNSAGTVINYPISDGTVTLTDTGSCSVNLEIPVNVTCDTGSGETKTALVQFTVSSIPGFTGYAAYVDNNGNVQLSGRVGTSLPSSRTFCARTVPAPRVEAASLTSSSIVCNYFCSSSQPAQCELWRYTIAQNVDYTEFGQYVNCSGSLTSEGPLTTSGSFFDVCIDANYTPTVFSGNPFGNPGVSFWTQISSSCP